MLDYQIAKWQDEHEQEYAQYIAEVAEQESPITRLQAWFEHIADCDRAKALEQDWMIF